MQKIPFQSLRKSKKVSKSMPPTPQPLLGRPLETVYMGGGNGRFWGRDVKRDVAIHLYIYLICPVPFIWKEFCRYVFRPVAAKDPGSLNRDPS